MKLTKTEISDKLKEIYSAMNDGKPIPSNFDNADLRTDLALTSVGMLYFVIVLEEAFNIRFEGSELGNFATVADVVEFVWSNQQ